MPEKAGLVIGEITFEPVMKKLSIQIAVLIPTPPIPTANFGAKTLREVDAATQTTYDSVQSVADSGWLRQRRRWCSNRPQLLTCR
jgi:hypothetical protein